MKLTQRTAIIGLITLVTILCAVVISQHVQERPFRAEAKQAAVELHPRHLSVVTKSWELEPVKDQPNVYRVLEAQQPDMITYHKIAFNDEDLLIRDERVIRTDAEEGLKAAEKLLKNLVAGGWTIERREMPSAIKLFVQLSKDTPEMRCTTIKQISVEGVLHNGELVAQIHQTILYE